MTDSDVADTSTAGAGWSGTEACVAYMAVSLHSDSPISFTACDQRRGSSLRLSLSDREAQLTVHVLLKQLWDSAQCPRAGERECAAAD